MKRFFGFVLALQFAMCFVVVLDIAIARQIIGFAFLLFVPGIILLRIVKLNRLDIIETILFSSGLSIALLMFVGLLMNELFPLIGISDPLSTLPSIITVNILILILGVLSYRIDKNFAFNIKPSPSILLLFLPFLSIFGATLVNNSGNNSVLLLLIIIISGLIILGSLYERLISTNFYSLAILSIAVALLFHESMTTPHLYGRDIYLEYYVFRLVKENSLWKNVSLSTLQSTLQSSNFNAMLSITILPALYSNLLNMPGVWFFKIVYPLIFSLVPLGLYQVYQKQIGKRTAFLSTFFFMSSSFFYHEHLGNTRQMIGELFFVLLLLLLLDKKIDSFKKNVLSIVFGMGLVVSHYALSYLYMFFISFVWLISILTHIKIRITATTIILFFSTAFSWYVYVSASSIFEAAVLWGDHVLTTFSTELFDLPSRQSTVLTGIGMGGPAESIGHEIGRLIHYVTELFIVIGVIDTLWKHKKSRYDQEYILLSVASTVLLLMSVVIPYFTFSIGITRIYYISSVILAPFCIIGGENAIRYIASIFGKVFARPNIKTLVLTVLIFFFLIDIGFIYEITGDVPSSNALSMYRVERVEFYNKYSSDYDICGARWLARVRNPSTMIYADYVAKKSVLAGYGMIPQQNALVLFNNIGRIYKGYVYLRSVNTIDGKIMYRYIPYKYEMFDISEITYLFDYMNKIYSNGECTIYKD